MGFGFRKTFSSGPFRFTVSPRGVSSSFGVRGARVTSGPRGTFVTVSSHGVYYRHRIDSRSTEGASHQDAGLSAEQPLVDSVFKVPVAELITSNQTELVEKLNENISATNPAIFAFILSLGAAALIPFSPTLASFAGLIGLLGTAATFRSFKASHTHHIHYSLEEQAAKEFAATVSAISSLSSCACVWAMNTKSSTSDLKRNAGAATLITRKPASIGNLPTPGFRSSLPISAIEANGTILHFLPDQILLFSAGRYASIQYEQLRVECAATRYIETESVPHDSRQIGTTWRFVNKNGGPDRRFNDNRQIPILEYGELTLHTTAGLQVILQTSSAQKASVFASRFNTSGTTPPPQDRQAEGSVITEEGNAIIKRCYSLFGLARPATLQEASSAYHRLATLYHPDKYEHLAPEMKTLAAAKMKEINAAYALIKIDIGNH